MATPNQFTAPGTEYGGDEVSAIVLDPGYATTRAGFAGEDAPKSVIPTYYGLVASDAANGSGAGGGHAVFGDNAVHEPRPRMEIRNPLAGGGADDWVADWDAAARLWEHAMTSRLTGPRRPRRGAAAAGKKEDGDVEMADVGADAAVDAAVAEAEARAEAEAEDNPLGFHPLMMSEPGRSTSKSREKVIEIAMENWEVPAFYLAKTGVLSAFANGKPIALVVDVGASMISVTPVYDGMVLRKGVKTSPLGGNFVADQIRMMFKSQPSPVPLVPHYMISAKTAVPAGEPSQATYKRFDIPPTDSFRLWQEERVLTDFKQSVVEVWPGPGKLSGVSPQGISNEEVAARGSPGKPFEMPDGWNQVFGVERNKVVEGLFDEKAAYTDENHPAPKPEHVIPELILASLNAVDQEIRPALLNNIVIVGAASQQKGLVKRFDNEIKALFPGPNVRLHTGSTTGERSFAAWIGGSILASLGSFHQLWISRKEYNEHGPSIIDKRSK